MSSYFYFTRHGQTIWNVENKICGATDIALTSLGHDQATELGKRIKEEHIHIDEILYFSIIRRGCEIHILQNGAGKILRTRKRIEEIEAELRREYFCRIHKRFLVNPRYITEVKKSEIKMDNNEILSVSKAKRKTFEDMFAEYLSYRK